jgi:hypothetical protein
MSVENKRHTNAHQPFTDHSPTEVSIPPLRQFFVFIGLDSFLKHFLRNSSNRLKKSAAQYQG